MNCIARTLGNLSRYSIGIAGATGLTRPDFRFTNFTLLKAKGLEVREQGGIIVLYL